MGSSEQASATMVLACSVFDWEVLSLKSLVESYPERVRTSSLELHMNVHTHMHPCVWTHKHINHIYKLMKRRKMENQKEKKIQPTGLLDLRGALSEEKPSPRISPRSTDQQWGGFYGWKIRQKAHTKNLCPVLISLDALRTAHLATSTPLKSFSGIKAVWRQGTSGNGENVTALTRVCWAHPIGWETRKYVYSSESTLPRMVSKVDRGDGMQNSVR